PFARVPHEIEGKLAAAEWFHPGELRLERGREGVRAWAGIDREEVEVIPEPLRTDVGDVVQLLPFLRRLNILGPQHVFDQISSSPYGVGLDGGGYGGWFLRRADMPRLSWSGHLIRPCEVGGSGEITRRPAPRYSRGGRGFPS